jgi:hypothetical protein
MASESRAEDHLKRFAPLERFWIYRTEHAAPGLIHYSDQDGKAWTLMEDDEDLLDSCIELLESRGCSVFDDVESMDAYVSRLGPL